MKGGLTMKKAVKYVYDANPFYVHCKKHFCPKCGNKLDLRYVSKIVNSKSPEAKNYDFSVGDTFFVGDVEFRTRYFFCNGCQSSISFQDMKKYEKGKCKSPNDSIICDEILDVDNSGLTIKCNNSDIFISFAECVKNYANENSLENSRCVATRDITKLTFTFYTQPKLRVIFKKHFFKDLVSGRSAVNKFLELQKTINKYGYTSYDLS